MKTKKSILILISLIALSINGFSQWLLTGNNNIAAPPTNFIGTTSTGPQALEFQVNGVQSGWLDYLSPYKTFFGYKAGLNTTAVGNTAFGYNALTTNVNGTSNTAIGAYSLYTANQSSAKRAANTAVGDSALFANSTGIQNTVIGFLSSNANTTGGYNTMIGATTFYHNTTGSYNTGGGFDAIFYNTTGIDNTAFGAYSLTEQNGWGYGHGNSAFGAYCLRNCGSTTARGMDNSALGDSSLFANTGQYNTAVGYQALDANTSGNNNTAIGYQALTTNTTGTYLTTIGNGANISSATGITNATAIGANAYVGASNALVLGSINGVNGATASTNVGIGTTTPSHKLSVVGSGSFDTLYLNKKISGTSDSILVRESNIVKYKLLSSTLSSTSWSLSGNAATSSNFIGTTGNVSMRFRSNNTQRMIIDSLGNVGIGTSAAPIDNLEVNGNISVTGGGSTGNSWISGRKSLTSSTASFGLCYGTPTSYGPSVTMSGQGTVLINSYGTGSIILSNTTSSGGLTFPMIVGLNEVKVGLVGWFGCTPLFHVVGNSQFDGNVGIGTTTPVAKLEVLALDTAGAIVVRNNADSVEFRVSGNGYVVARDIQVKTGIIIPDYVFEKDYKLKSLSEVEKFINANKHLPGVPSAADVKKDGLNVAEMDASLLKKVEELTLYVIDLKKQNETMQKEIELLKKK
jgi:hypothetical protein